MPQAHIGECALCRHTRELRDSHFLPKALYRLNAGERETEPAPGPRKRTRSEQTAIV